MAWPSGRPIREHPYGHGKAQHLSALAEAAILAAVAVWIAFEAITRLIDGSTAVSATWYAFVLMAMVLVVDAGRSTASLRVGRAEHNAALLANAAHFASDFVGSLAVLVGLILVAFGVQGGDSVAAIFVSVIVLAGAARLAWINVDVLMDRAPTGTAGRVEQAALSVPGVTAVRSVRVREAGGESFAEVVIGVSRLAGLERSHDTMDLVEQAVIEELGRAQVVVHAEPDAVGRARQRPHRGRRAARARVWSRRTTSRCWSSPTARRSRCTCGSRRTRRCRRPARW